MFSSFGWHGLACTQAWPWSPCSLKTEYRLRKGETIETKKICGKISKLGFLYLELETNESEKIKIPYSKIGGQEIKTSNENSFLKKISFPVSVEKSEKISIIKQNLKISKDFVKRIGDIIANVRT
mgnify:CR=1 FL=1